MAITTLGDVTYDDFKLNTTINPEHFDTNFQELVDKLDEVINLINKYEQTTDSDSGGDNIALTTITDLTGNSVQAVLESFRNQLKSVTDGASGADFVKMTAVSGLSGATVQAVIESLKTFVDTGDTALTTHKSSSDHDSRYYTETELNAGQLDTRYYTETELTNGQLDSRYFTETELGSTTDSNSGADKIGATTVSGITGNTVQSILEALKVYIDSQSPLTIPNDSITNSKLATDVKMGSLASLTTTEKSSVTGAINEVDANADTAEVKRKLEIENIEGALSYPVVDDAGNIVRVEHIDKNISVDRVNAIQLVSNGNFVDGSDWSPFNATESIANNIYSLTGNGLAVGCYNSQSVTFNNGDKYYAYVRARVTNSLATDISLGTNLSFTSFDTQSSPSQNQWYELSGILTASTETSLRIKNGYSSTGDATGAVMEIDGRAGFGVKLINLTETFGAGNEPDLAWCDAHFGRAGHWEGLKSFWNTYNITALRTDVIEYYSASNLVTDGNMTDADNWDVVSSTDSVLNNTLINTADGVASTPRSVQTNSELDNQNEKFYGGCKARVDNALSTFLRLRTAGGAIQDFYEQSSPNTDKWYDLTGIITRSTSASSSEFYIIHNYASAGDANGKVMQVQEARLINLTSNNMTDFTADQLDKLGYGETYEIIKETRTDSNANVLTEITYIADDEIVHVDREVA